MPIPLPLAIPIPEPILGIAPNPLAGGPGPVFGPPGGANFFRPPPLGLLYYYPGPDDTPLIFTFKVSPCFREKSTGALLKADF